MSITTSGFILHKMHEHLSVHVLFSLFFPSRVETQGNRAQPYFMEHLVSGAEGNAEAFRTSVLSLVLSLLPYPRLLVTSTASTDISLCRGAGGGEVEFLTTSTTGSK